MKDFFTLDNQLCFAIYEAGSQLTKLYSKALQPYGLTYPQYLVLLALWEKDNLTLKELGDRLNLGTGTLTPMINRMDSNGWVKKKRSIEDERKILITLEAKAIQKKEEIARTIAREVQACQIEFQEYEMLMDSLLTLRKKLRNYNERT